MPRRVIVRVADQVVIEIREPGDLEAEPAGVMAAPGILEAAADLVARKHVRPDDCVPLRVFDSKRIGRALEGSEIRRSCTSSSLAIAALRRVCVRQFVD